MKNMGYRTLPSMAVSKGAQWVAGPLGPYLATNMQPSCAHLGLSYDQWASILAHRNGARNVMPGTGAVIRARYPAYARALGMKVGYGDFGSWGETSSDFGDFGDVCTRTEKRYKRKKKLYKRKKAKFKQRGRRFMWIRTGDGSKRLATIKRRMAAIKAKAKSKSCVWVGRKKRKKQIAKLAKEERVLEKQLQSDQEQTQLELKEATDAAIAAQSVEAAQPGANPFLILGGVAAVGLVMVFLAKKK